MFLKKSVDKIPQTLIDTFKAKMDKNYDFSVDINKSFEDQNLLNETKAIFANIFRDYWATPYQKERILAKEKYDRIIIEKEKRERYNPNDLYAKSEDIMEEFFTEMTMFDKSRIFSYEILKSPIVQEEYFRQMYGEISDSVQLGRNLRQNQEKAQTETVSEAPVYTEEQIGRATINVPTEQKDKSEEQIERDSSIIEASDRKNIVEEKGE